MNKENELNKSNSSFKPPENKEELENLLNENFDRTENQILKTNYPLIENIRNSLSTEYDINVEKYTDKDIGNYLIMILQWLLNNKEAVFIKEFYYDPTVKYTIPWETVKTRFLKRPELKKIRNYMKDVLEIRLAKAALNGKYKENFTKFLMINNFGYKSEKVDQDVNVTNKDVKFEFGNNNLIEEQNADDENKEIDE